VRDAYPEGSVVIRLHGVQGPIGGLFAATVRDLQSSNPFTRVNNTKSAHLTDDRVAEELLKIEAMVNDSTRKVGPIYHLAASEAMSPYEIAVAFADELGISPNIITPSTQEVYEAKHPHMVPRPKKVTLDTALYEKTFNEGKTLPTTRASITDFVQLGYAKQTDQ